MKLPYCTRYWISRAQWGWRTGQYPLLISKRCVAITFTRLHRQQTGFFTFPTASIQNFWTIAATTHCAAAQRGTQRRCVFELHEIVVSPADCFSASYTGHKWVRLSTRRKRRIHRRWGTHRPAPRLILSSGASTALSVPRSSLVRSLDWLRAGVFRSEQTHTWLTFWLPLAYLCFHCWLTTFRAEFIGTTVSLYYIFFWLYCHFYFFINKFNFDFGAVTDLNIKFRFTVIKRNIVLIQLFCT